MLPPCSADVKVEIACPSFGATPKLPSIGRSGTASRSSPGTGSFGRTVPASTSMSQSMTGVPGRLGTKSGSTTFSAWLVLAQPVERFVRIRSKRTTRASPGTAPSMKNGPVCGLGRVATWLRSASKPRASTVVVTTVSPGAMRNTGSCCPNVFRQISGTNRCVATLALLPKREIGLILPSPKRMFRN